MEQEPLLNIIKALLHCAILSATCLAMLENVALQVAEVGCYTTTRSQRLAIFLAGLGWAWGELQYQELLGTIKREVCACVLVQTAVKLRENLLEGIYCAMALPVSAIRCQKSLELSSTSCNVSCNPKKNARQSMLHCAILRQLVSQRLCEASC